MQRSGNGPWGRWFIPFYRGPGIGWRLHMFKMAAEILPVRAPPHRWHG
jgi:hypothetical protein